MALGGEKLKAFTNSSKKMTPAKISKMSKYDLTKDNEVLADQNSDRLQRATAERNIQNKLVKLGELALYQEGQKGFEDGIPNIAMPFLFTQGVTPEAVGEINSRLVSREEPPMAKYGMEKAQNGKDKRFEDPDYFGNRDGRVSKREQEFFDASIAPRLAELRGRQLDPGQSFSEGLPVMPGGFFRRPGYRTNYSRSMSELPAPRVVKEGTTSTRSSGSIDELKEIFADPKYNQVKKVAYEKYKQNHPSTTYTEDQFWQNFMRAQEHVWSIADKIAAEPDWDVSSEDWDNYGGMGVEGKNRKYKEWAAGAGVDPMDEEAIKAFQEGYYILAQLQTKPEFASVLKGWDLKPKGVKDADGNLLDRPVSEFQKGIFGNTTNRQQLVVNDETTTPPETTQDSATEQEDITGVDNKKPLKFWNQDLVNLLANESLTNIRRYPYMRYVNPDLPDPLFEDPERQLQANQENAATNAMALGLLGDESSTPANLAYMQGQLAAAQANVEAQKANRNVEIYNQFQIPRSELINKAMQYNDQGAYDYITGAAVTDEADNLWRNQKRAQRAKLINTTFTNAADTQRLNELYDFKVFPNLWGEGQWSPSSEVDLGGTPVDIMLGNNAGSGTSRDRIEQTRQWYKDNFPNLSAEDIDKEIIKGMNGGTNGTSERDAFAGAGYKKKKGGSVDPFSVLRKFVGGK